MLDHFHISADQKTVSWKNEGLDVVLHFQYKAYAYPIDYLNQVLVHSDARESGSTNLCLYGADGSVKARPQMPKLQREVGGVYAVWFISGNRKQTVVLHTNEYSPYDTACTFDLETHTFTRFHPTK